MKITSVEALHLRLPVIEAIADGTQEVLAVRVRTDKGLVGLGEAVSSSYIARAVIEAPRSAPRRQGLAAALIGSDPLDPEARWQDMYEAGSIYGRHGVAIHALSAVDTALWDIRARAEGVVGLGAVGAKARPGTGLRQRPLPRHGRGGAGGATLRLVEEGVTAIKFGWGPFGSDRRFDLELLEAITGAAGDGLEIMVDAGRVWDVETAVARIPELFERFGIT